MKRNCVLIVGGTWGFPNGMASTRRIILLARAFMESNHHVEVIHTTISEWPGKVFNKKTEGWHKGIHFQYATGTTIAAKRFLARRIMEWHGRLKTAVLICRYSRRYNVKAIIIYSRQISAVAWICVVANTAGIPTVLELNEWPVARKGITQWRRMAAVLFCRWSPFMVDGFIVISHFIRDKILEIKPDANKNLLVLPILVNAARNKRDKKKEKQFPENDSSPYILFSGSLDYVEALEMILDAFALVVGQKHNCRLVITGKGSDGAIEALKQNVSRRGLGDHVELMGYIPSEVLDHLQQDAACLLAPLENDDQSRARMPTKIAEYLMTGCPVITSAIGEVTCFLENAKNAYLCPPEDIRSFADTILHVLTHREDSDLVGKSGRVLAQQAFVYKNYTKRLNTFVRSLSGRKT